MESNIVSVDHIILDAYATVQLRSSTIFYTGMYRLMQFTYVNGIATSEVILYRKLQVLMGENDKLQLEWDDVLDTALFFTGNTHCHMNDTSRPHACFLGMFGRMEAKTSAPTMKHWLYWEMKQLILRKM